MSEQEEKVDILSKLKDPKFKIKIYMYSFVVVFGLIILFLSGNSKDKVKHKISLEKTGEKMIESGEKIVEQTGMFVKNNEEIQNVMKKANEVKDEVSKEIENMTSSKEKGIDENELSGFLDKMKKEREASMAKVDDGIVEVQPSQISKDEELLDVESKFEEGLLPPMRNEWKEEKYKELVVEHEKKQEEEKQKEIEKKKEEEKNSWDNFMNRKANDDFLNEISSGKNHETSINENPVVIDVEEKTPEIVSSSEKIEEKETDLDGITEKNVKITEEDKKFEKMFKDLY